MLYRETIPVFVVGWNRGLRQHKSVAWWPNSFCSVDVVCSWRCICRWLYIKSRTNFTACCCSVTDAVRITWCKGGKNSTSGPHDVLFMRFVCISEKQRLLWYTALTDSFFTTETESVYCAVRTGDEPLTREARARSHASSCKIVDWLSGTGTVLSHTFRRSPVSIIHHFSMSPSSTCCSYQKDRWAKQWSLGCIEKYF